MDKEKSSYENNQIFVLFMKSLDLKVNDMVKFLEVSANTVYNYRTLDTDALPSKVIAKLFDLIDVDNATDAKNKLMHLDYEGKNLLLSKLGKNITARTILSNDSNENPNKGTLELSKLGSKVFTDALIYEIDNVVNGVNDYDFISYVRKYKKGDNSGSH